MRNIISGMVAAVLTTSAGFAETAATDNVLIGSDVVLESAVKEVISLPGDAVNAMNSVIQYSQDEARTAAIATTSVLDKDEREKEARVVAQRDEKLAAVDNAWDSSNDILFRSYKVSPKIGDLLQMTAANKSALSIDVADFFKGVEFSSKASARYLPEFQSLFVAQTLGNLLAIEDVLASYQREQKNLMGHQIEIETKFIEVSQSTLNELGFSWGFVGSDSSVLPGAQDLLSGGLRSAASALGGAAPSAGVLEIASTASGIDWNMAITALEQSTDSDVLSAPRVVTHTGSPAVIQIGEERMIPKSFEVENQNTSPYVQHADWNLELMGVHMEVTPYFRNDGLIDLSLNSKILDYIGNDSYRIAPEYTGNSTILTVTEVNATLPYLRIRELKTSVTVADGNTIGMGGLIYERYETYGDKVPVLGSIPFLGRLFRSEGARSEKRNLIILVTATQVDVNGRRSADLAQQK